LLIEYGIFLSINFSCKVTGIKQLIQNQKEESLYLQKYGVNDFT